MLKSFKQIESDASTSFFLEIVYLDLQNLIELHGYIPFYFYDIEYQQWYHNIQTQGING